MAPMPPARMIDVGEVRLSVHEAGPEDGLPVLLLHGWPELAYSWNRQIPVLAEAGYRVIAPDNRGFGASDKPYEVSAYGVDALIGDYTGLLNALDIEKAVFIGHDWGGIIMWHAAVLKPERFLGAVGVNTPHMPRMPEPVVDMLIAAYGADHYIAVLQDEAADDLFVGREAAFFDFIFSKPPSAEAMADLPASIRHLPARFETFLARGGLASEDDVVVPAADRRVYAQPSPNRAGEAALTGIAISTPIGRGCRGWT